MHTQTEIAKICGCTKVNIGQKENRAFGRLSHRFEKNLMIEEKTEKAFIKKYFEYHDIFADAKPVELDEMAKRELQSILGAKVGLKMKRRKAKATADEKLKDSIQELKTAYSDLKAKDEECKKLKRQVKDNLKSTKSSEINPNEKSETSEVPKPRDEGLSHDEL